MVVTDSKQQLLLTRQSVQHLFIYILALPNLYSSLEFQVIPKKLALTSVNQFQVTSGILNCLVNEREIVP